MDVDLRTQAELLSAQAEKLRVQAQEHSTHTEEHGTRIDELNTQANDLTAQATDLTAQADELRAQNQGLVEQVKDAEAVVDTGLLVLGAEVICLAILGVQFALNIIAGEKWTRQRWVQWGNKRLLDFLVLVLLIFALAPIFWMVNTSLPMG